MKNFIRIFIACILLFWTATSFAAPVFPPLTDREDWAGTYFKNKKLGFTHSEVKTHADGFRVKTRTYMKLQLSGAAQVTTLSQESELNKDLSVNSFSLLQEISGHQQKIDARVVGDQLEVEVATLEYKKKKSVPFSKNTVLSSTYLLNILKDGLEVGKRGVLDLFVEPFQMNTKLEYRVSEKEKVPFQGKLVETFVIDQKIGGLESTLWVTADGTVVQEETNQGFTSRLETKDKAQSMPDGAISVTSFITLSRVKTARKIASPRQARSLKLELANLGRPDSLPEDQRQKILKVVKQGENKYKTLLHVRSEPANPKKNLTLPVAGAPKEYLADSSEIQSEHPQIRALARDLVAKTDSAWAGAKKINQWVFRNMEKDYVDAFTALDALRDRKGECQSHTNLFTALARSAGIPTRIVNGLAYSKAFDGFVYHAWPEVYVGEWRAMDPTFGQDLVDATHIKLSQGKQATQFKLMEFIGRVEIELIEN